MNRTQQIEGSTLGRKVSIRFGRSLFDGLKQHLGKDPPNEQFAFGLFAMAKTADGTLLILQDLMIPEDNHMAQQSASGVSPSKPFQATVYLLAQAKGLGILDIHTHPFQDVPRFSGIDQAESARNAKYICGNLPHPITHAMVVFGNGVQAHDAVIYDRSLNAYREIDYIEVLGRRNEVVPTGRVDISKEQADPLYSRQALIPGWDQQSIARQRITAQLAVNAFLALVHGDRFGGWDYAYYNHLTAQTLTATTTRREDCPLCGPEGVLAAGDELEQSSKEQPTWRKVEVAG